MVATKSYYIIKPTPSLLEATIHWDESTIEFISEPQCWESIEKAPQIEKAKLAFLINLYTEYALPELIELLGIKPISLTVFDRWWSIERLNLFGNIGEFGAGILPVDIIELTDDANLNSWLSQKIKNSNKSLKHRALRALDSF